MGKFRLPIATRIVAVSGISLGIFAGALLFVVRRTVKHAVYKETAERVAVAQNIFRDMIQREGAPVIIDGDLYLGSRPASGDNSLVDHLKRLTGADATLFGLRDGKPIRASTTIEKLDGSGRNVGTELSGAARAAFDRGESFAGTSPVAGRNFINRYDALRDARGEIVGVVYTGIPLTTMDAAAREIMHVVVAGTAIALLPSMLALYMVTRPVGRTFLRAVTVAQGLARGNVDQTTDRSFMNDEFGDVNKAFGDMIAYQQRMTLIADAIAQGDLSNDVAPASSLDRLGIAFARMTENLRALVLQLETTALTDNLTLLGNRRAFEHHMATEISRFARHGGDLSLAMIDIDEFKAVNDRAGHQGGDAVLAKLGAILKTVRLEDAAFRLGGDEFALILPNTSAAEAKLILERIRAAAQAQLLGATISVGVAASIDGSLDAQTLQRRADRALYAGKQQGRNTVVVYADDDRPPAAG